jgi:PAS domain S-box-containing protein
MTKKTKIYLLLSILIMSVFFVIKTSVLLEIQESTRITRGIEYVCFLLFIPLFILIVREINNVQTKKLNDTDKFIDKAAIISVTDRKGKITYVNEKFEKVSGWKLEEVIGKDHSIVNSGTQPDGYWGEMYETVLKGEIWNDVVTNKAKDGSLYYVDTYIRARFGTDGRLDGFSSIRQDITELKKKELDIRNRMNAINQSNAVIEFDLSGNIVYANQNFCDSMGYSLKELKGKHHSIFVTENYSKSDEYKEFWNKLKNGDFISEQFSRIKKNGEEIWLQATYNPIFDNNGQVVRVMKIAVDITDKVLQSKEIERKNTYLEHAAKILRHDMHSGINTYIPRGVNSLERRLTQEDITNLKIEAPLKMIKEGLKHSQKVYKGVYEFTNLVKKDVVLNKEECNIKDILKDYLSSTAYTSQVVLDDNLPTIELNEPLFCTAVDNLIRNGLKYNDSETKFVKIYSKGDSVYIQDNGRGITQEDFNHLSKPYTRKEGQKESGTGLGLNICVAILEEHGFDITCEKNEIGTKMKIKLK